MDNDIALKQNRIRQPLSARLAKGKPLHNLQTNRTAILLSFSVKTDRLLLKKEAV